MTLLNHLINFLAPALWMAVFLPCASRLLWRRAHARLKLHEQIMAQLIAGVLILIVGLVALSRDGAMLTYATLVAVAGLLQWLMLR